MRDYTARLAALMREYLGEPILRALNDDDIEEIYVNPDGVVRHVSHTHGRLATPFRISAADIESFLRAVATQAGTGISTDRPALAAALPRSFGKCRIQGFVPPITEGPAMVVRKPPARLIPLEEYVAQGVLSATGCRHLKRIISNRRNIIVAGPTASGKTTLCNAILAEISAQFPDDRLLVLEGTPELRITSQDYLRLHTSDTINMRQLVQYSLRCTPNRLIIGEVRDGAAKDLLDAWITGHPGGCGTVHGEDCERALQRLARLARDGAGGADQRAMVLQAVHYVVHIAGYGTGREVRAIGRVTGTDGGAFTLDYCDLDADPPVQR